MFLAARQWKEGDVDVGEEFDPESFGFAVGLGAASGFAHGATKLAADGAESDYYKRLDAAKNIQHTRTPRIDIRANQAMGNFAADTAINGAVWAIRSKMAKDHGSTFRQTKNLLAQFVASSVGTLFTTSMSYLDNTLGYDSDGHRTHEIKFTLANEAAGEMRTLTLGFVLNEF
jgi:hypothetical protein